MKLTLAPAAGFSSKRVFASLQMLAIPEKKDNKNLDDI